ncbi:DUF4342 domain-containing protein [Anaerosphaera multitolerans]|uniref:DUF4342 domain-containing protein n=1 Tax=Anaerosphaera multitolerans TaxID=2487351 RepID=A0A437S8G1_9FIRM|nr:DUF4342 domain-containing protein [Anaerosphaera multitolerans]RVU55221.1 DUF4342 domain-containing protein [Anaerosphaera multitolerans]
MITIEKIDYVMNITGVPYEVVRKALLDSDGDVDKAIKLIKNSLEPFENKENKKDTIDFNDIKDAIKSIWEEGNASRLTIERNGELLLNISLTVSAIGIVIAPVAALLGVGIMGTDFLGDFVIKIILSSGEVIDVKEYIKSLR